MDIERRPVRVNGVELNVVIAGDGPDVLLVHGFPDDHSVWRRQIPVLVAAGYRVIALDTRGRGDSDIAPLVADYKVDRLVADLVGLLDALGIRNVRLVGHDWGAMVGWLLAMRHPQRVERFIALSVGHPNAYARGGLGQKIRGYYILLIQLRGLIELLTARCDWWLLGAMYGFTEDFARWKSGLSRPGRLTAGYNYYRANLHLLFPRDYPRVRVPVIGIWSSGDRLLVESQMKNSGQYCVAGWQYVRLDGCDHWPQLSAPDAVNALLLKHLA